MEEEKTLKQEVGELNSKLDKLILSGAAKEIKPKKVSKAMRKKGYVNYIVIDGNGNMKTVKVQIDQSTTTHDKIPRLATPDCILNWKGNPTIIQPAWSTKPISIIDNFEETKKENYLAVGHRLILNRMEEGAIKSKKKLPGAVIFALIVGLVILGYMLLG